MMTLRSEEPQVLRVTLTFRDDGRFIVRNIIKNVA